MIKKQNLEKTLKGIKVLKEIKDIADKANKQVYLVGGVLRDILLGRKLGDIDIAISGKGEDFARALGKYFPLKEEIDEYRVIKEDREIDVLGLGTTEILEDLRRRDFTINAMAYNLLDKRFIDPFNGVNDLEKGTVRAVSRKNIAEDKCRILRGLRFRSTFGFDIEEGTLDFFKEYASGIMEVAAERIHAELVEIFSEKNSHLAVMPVVFDGIFPGFLKMEEISGGKITDNLLQHSIRTLKEMEYYLNKTDIFTDYSSEVGEYIEEKRVGLKIASLLHDIKKPETMEVKGNEVHFYGHDKMAADWFEERGKELRFSGEERDYISDMINNHMWIHLLAAQDEITERAKRRMVFKMEEDVIGLAFVSLADQKASTGEKDSHLLGVCNEIIRYYFEKQQEVEKPILQGRHLIEHFGLEPGPLFGEILDKVHLAYEEGEIRTTEEALDYVEKEILPGLDIEE